LPGNAPEPLPIPDDERLLALVRLKLSSNRDKEKMHLRDMLAISLIDASWPGRYAPERIRERQLSRRMRTPDRCQLSPDRSILSDVGDLPARENRSP
jgi:hypothetical protein